MRLSYLYSIVIVSGVVLCGLSEAQEAGPVGDRNRQVEQFVEEAARYFLGRSNNAACTQFTQDIRWRFPHVKLFVVDEHDLLWFITDELPHIWTRLLSVKSSLGLPLIQTMRQKGPQGGWVAAIWNEDLVKAFVKNLRKGRHLYTIGALVFVESAAEVAHELLLRAHTFIQEAGLKRAIEQMNNPNGTFLRGSLSVALYDYGGICLADSYDTTRVGQNTSAWVDDRGRLVFRDYQEALKLGGGAACLEHRFHGNLQRVFLHSVIDPHTKKVFILASGYYPDVDENFVIDFGRQAGEVLLKRGTQQAFADFIAQREKYFKARLSLVIYDEKGIIRAHTRFPSVVGSNAYDRLDQAGNPITKIILQEAQDYGHGWVFYYRANAAELVYLEKLITPEGTFIITVEGYTPMTKHQIAASIAEWLASRFDREPASMVLGAISRGESIWNRGFRGAQGQIYSNFFVEIYDTDNFCLTAGSEHQKIWQPMDKGFLESMKVMRKKRLRSGWFSDYKDKMRRSYYICPSTKGDEKYTVFVGYRVPEVQSRGIE